MTLRRVLLTTMVVAALAAACGDDSSPVESTGSDPTATAPETTIPGATSPVEGDTAVWSIDPSTPVAGTDQSFTAMVSRLGCSGGVTGDVHAPEVTIGATEIAVEFRVAPLDPEGAYNCPGNDLVPYEVELGQPIGDRTLVDGACAGEAGTTSFCWDGDVRWPSE
jgi:hypothetical protein